MGIFEISSLLCFSNWLRFFHFPRESKFNLSENDLRYKEYRIRKRTFIVVILKYLLMHSIFVGSPLCLLTKYENFFQVCSLIACHPIETINRNIHNGVKFFIYTYCCSFILTCSSISFFFFSQPKAAPDLNAVSYFCKATASSHGNESSKLSSVSLWVIKVS